MHKIATIGTIGLAALLISAADLRAQWTLDAEAGPVWSGYNDIRIPGKGGTLFSLSEDLKADAGLFVRARLTWQFKPRHALSIFAAPLSLKAEWPRKVIRMPRPIFACVMAASCYEKFKVQGSKFKVGGTAS